MRMHTLFVASRSLHSFVYGWLYMTIGIYIYSPIYIYTSIIVLIFFSSEYRIIRVLFNRYPIKERLSVRSIYSILHIIVFIYIYIYIYIYISCYISLPSLVCYMYVIYVILCYIYIYIYIYIYKYKYNYINSLPSLISLTVVYPLFTVTILDVGV